MSADLSVVLITAPPDGSGRRLATRLVEERLAACVNVVPGVTSLFRWEGRVEDASECLLIAKTRADRLERLAERVREIHPYDLPEIVALPLIGGSEAYLEWIRRESAEEEGA